MLECSRTGTYTLVYKHLGHTTVKRTETIDSLPFILNITLVPERLELNEVAVTSDENPALRVMRKAIEKRKSRLAERQDYTADFYSKGLMRIKNAPEKFLGQDLGDFGGGLDSTRSGIIYLSETVSKIARRKNRFKEKILASKVSGDDNGFSFNNAADVDFSFYQNTVLINDTRVISPIANDAFSYYSYRLLGTFYDEDGRLINKIGIRPKRKPDLAFNGEVFIVEDDWSLYAVNVSITGERAQIIPVDTLFVTQSFNFSKTGDAWLKTLQQIDFQFGIFGFKGDGRFIAGYKNYDLDPQFEKREFTNEVVAFEKGANKKDSVFWQGIRPVPLTLEETGDYTRKDSIQLIRKSQKYLDSIDAKGNRFTLGSLLLGYTYSNTFKEKYYTFTSPLATTTFNTVQGWRGELGFRYLQLNEDRGSRLSMSTRADYGVSEKRFRPTAGISYRFNRFNRRFLRVRGGSEVLQFNTNNPISAIGNSFFSLLFERNFAKFYQRTFAELFYAEELFNGFYVNAKIAREERDPLFNTTDYYIINNKNQTYTSNNPLDPSDFDTAAIEPHRITILSLSARIRLGQKYLSYPDGKFSYSEDRFPTLNLGYKSGFASTDSDKHFTQLKARLYQDFALGNKGRFSYNLKAGTFFNADGISFADFQHFNGNQTSSNIGRDYLDSYFLLPYYELSTNQNYAEAHVEHNFKGYVLGKLPLIRLLNAHLILNANVLATGNNQPYSEWGIALGNLGFKKFRGLRLGFVQRHFMGKTESGFNFGVQF